MWRFIVRFLTHCSCQPNKWPRRPPLKPFLPVSIAAEFALAIFDTSFLESSMNFATLLSLPRASFCFPAILSSVFLLQSDTLARSQAPHIVHQQYKAASDIDVSLTFCERDETLTILVHTSAPSPVPSTKAFYMLPVPWRWASRVVGVLDL
jgi:hypothetical protein